MKQVREIESYNSSYKINTFRDEMYSMENIVNNMVITLYSDGQ